MTRTVYPDCSCCPCDPSGCDPCDFAVILVNETPSNQSGVTVSWNATELGTYSGSTCGGKLWIGSGTVPDCITAKLDSYCGGTGSFTTEYDDALNGVEEGRPYVTLEGLDACVKLVIVQFCRATNCCKELFNSTVCTDSDVEVDNPCPVSVYCDTTLVGRVPRVLTVTLTIPCLNTGYPGTSPITHEVVYDPAIGRWKKQICLNGGGDFFFFWFDSSNPLLCRWKASNWLWMQPGFGGDCSNGLAGKLACGDFVFAPADVTYSPFYGTFSGSVNCAIRPVGSCALTDSLSIVVTE